MMADGDSVADVLSTERRGDRYIVTFDPGFAELASSEFREVAKASAASRELAPGVRLFEGGGTFTEVAEAWREEPPVFVRHICPADTAFVANEGTESLDQLERVVRQRYAPELIAGESFSVQTRILAEMDLKPYDVNTRLAGAVSGESGAVVDVRRPEMVLSVVYARGPEDGTCTAYLGLSSVEDNLSDWAGGMRRFARDAEQVSRSEFKLLEALEVFQIELEPRGVALDLGAAPGGWTRVLRQRGLYVTAVDPGELHPSIRADSGVRHLRLTAEEYLARGPDRYDLTVNDMRMDARDSARLMVNYADYVYAHGQVIMTLKLPERSRRSVIDHARSILESAYSVLGLRQLFHNRSEVTVHLGLRGQRSPK